MFFENLIPIVCSALLAILLGIFFVGYLVAKPLFMRWFSALMLGVFLIWAAAGWHFFKGWAIIGNLAVAVVLFVVGFLVATRIYLSQSEKRMLPPITRPLGDPGDGHIAVLYFTHGEPPAYSPMPWIETFHELDADGVSFVPWVFRPFFLTNIRREYLVIGGSAHNKVHQIMLDSLILSLPEAVKQSVRFYQAFLDSNPRPDEMAIKAINDGASKLIVMPVFLTESSHTIAGREMLEPLELEKHGVIVCQAKPLWDTDALQQMFVDRTDKNLNGMDKAKVGILLIGHGQPEDWDKIYPTQTEQENSFRIQVRERLIQAGYRSENIVLAWMEFKKPGIEQGVKDLIAQGVERILIFSASISADSIHSDIQVPEAVNKANIPHQVEVVHLGAWGNSPLVIEAMRQRIWECAPTLK